MTLSIRSSPEWVPSGGVRLREKVYAPGTELGLHGHEHANLILVLEGGFEEECAGEVVARRPGELRVVPAELPHANRYEDRGARCLVVELEASWIAECSARGRSLQRSTTHAAATPASALARRIAEEFTIADDAASLSVEGLLLETLGSVLRLEGEPGAPRPPRWLVRVRERLHEEFADPPTADALARQAGVHPAHLHRSFRAHYRSTMGAFLRARRVAWAKEALLGTDASLASIALRAGFSDQSHFTRRFRSEVGTTPARYRRAGREA